MAPPLPSPLAPEVRQPLDLAEARRSCSFSSDAMSCLVAGSKALRDRNRWLIGLLKQDPRFEKSDRAFLGRTERFQRGHETVLAYFQVRNREGLSKEERDLLRLYIDDYLPIQVHESMFVPTMQNQSSAQQWASWGPAVDSGRWLGCYMQTELAHGSNLSGLMTTATLDRSTDEWVIDSNGMAGGKTWIGGAGLTATHGIVQAQMIIDGKNYGMHPFLVQLRDLETHKTLQGRNIRDMGPKVGATSMDNGYCVFTQVRIPRTNLLSRFQSVSASGQYQKHNAQAKFLTRGTMTLVRVGLCEIAAHHLARAVTIAVRYATVRRQGSSLSPSSTEENQIIAYPLVASRLLSAVSTAYALQFASRSLRQLYTRMIASLQEPNGPGRKEGIDLLPIVHGMSSLLKAYSTDSSMAGVQDCRRSMGGHGYSAASGIWEFERNQPNAGLTYEGDNYMLLSGPAANFLVKEYRRAQSRHRSSYPAPSLTYLSFRPGPPTDNQCAARSVSDLQRPTVQLSLLAHRARRLIAELSALRAKKNSSPPGVVGRGKPYSQDVLRTFDASLAYRASVAHGAYMVTHAFSTFIDGISSNPAARAEAQSVFGAPVSLAIVTALRRLCTLYALQVCVLPHLGDFTEDGYLTPKQVRWVREAAAIALAELRPDAVGLVDAWDFDDWYLDSALGASDGRAYIRFVEWMSLDPLNRSAQDGKNGGRDEHGVVTTYDSTIGKLVRGEIPAWTEKRAAKL